jgi:hypothetical protein
MQGNIKIDFLDFDSSLEAGDTKSGKRKCSGLGMTVGMDEYPMQISILWIRNLTLSQIGQSYNK